MSGCRELNKPVSERHNEAGKIILRAAMQASRSAEIVMMDVGRAADAENEGLPSKKRIPEWVLPTTMSPEEKKRLANGHVPDIMLYRPGGGGRPAEYTIIEIKYCRDHPCMIQTLTHRSRSLGLNMHP